MYGLRNGAGAGTAASARMLMDVLEHYFHPSNDGPWSPTLAQFLRGLTKHLLKRRAAEGRGIVGPAAWGGPLTEATVDAFAADVSRLVARAQFSKRSDLSRNAVAAAAGFAYLAPKRILPLVVSRFEQALESLTATHQLVAAIETLSACVRPLLCAPPELVGDDGDGSGGDAARLSAPPTQLLAAALEAVIPGVDANDPPKTLATLRFFVSALSAVGTLTDPDEEEPGGAGGACGGAQLPLAWGEWVDAVLGRVFNLLENCDPGTGGSRHGGGGTADGPGNAANSESTFLMYSSSMFRPAMELLFGRMGPAMLQRAQRQVAKWALGSTLPGVTCEVRAPPPSCAFLFAFCSPSEQSSHLINPLSSSGWRAHLRSRLGRPRRLGPDNHPPAAHPPAGRGPPRRGGGRRGSALLLDGGPLAVRCVDAAGGGAVRRGRAAAARAAAEGSDEPAVRVRAARAVGGAGGVGVDAAGDAPGAGVASFSPRLGFLCCEGRPRPGGL